MQDGWIRISKKYNIPVTCSAIPSVSSFKINSKNHLKYKTFITQEMLKKGFIASTHFYACTEHKEAYINNYLNELDSIFNILSKCDREEINIDDILDGPVCHSGFSRLN